MNTNFYSFWFDPIWNRTRIYHLLSNFLLTKLYVDFRNGVPLLTSLAQKIVDKLKVSNWIKVECFFVVFAGYDDGFYCWSFTCKTGDTSQVAEQKKKLGTKQALR